MRGAREIANPNTLMGKKKMRSRILVKLAVICVPFLFVNEVNAGQWGSWQRTNCYEGIDYKVRHAGEAYDGRHKWQVMIRNRYRADLWISFEITETGVSNVDTGNRTMLDAGESYESGWKFLDTGPAGRVLVWFDKLKFSGDSDYYGCDR